MGICHTALVLGMVYFKKQSCFELTKTQYET